MEKKYGELEDEKRIITTGSLNGLSLQKLTKFKGYPTLDFPLDAGGRYSVLIPVGLLPIDVAGWILNYW